MKRKRLTLAVGLVVILLGLGLVVSHFVFFAEEGSTAQNYYISTSGSDSNTGTIDAPFLTLEKAQTAIRTLKAGGNTNAVNVYLRAGTYYRTTTLNLIAQDSGTIGAPVTYQAYPGESVSLTGAQTITGLAPVTDPTYLSRLPSSAQPNILETDLTTQGITLAQLGVLVNRGGGRSSTTPAPLELMYQNQSMTLARYPNPGSWNYIADIPDGKDAGTFTYSDTQPSSWPNPPDDVWIHGYLGNDWTDNHFKISSLDPATKKITLDTSVIKPGYGILKGQWYYYENVLEALDSPGEWYVDRSNGKLFFYPPAPITADNPPSVTMLNKLVSLSHASYVGFNNITFEGTRSDAFSISSGDNISIRNNTLREIGNNAINASSTTNTTFANNDISYTGDGGIILSGGNLTTLAPSGNVVINNNIHDYSYWDRMYRPGALITGVGNRIAHNNFSNAPHTGILYGGNDNIIEYNSFDNLVTESNDAGAIYVGRTVTTYGNQIRYNKFNNIIGFTQGKYPSGNAYTVYLDDTYSSAKVFGNLFTNDKVAFLLGGGRNNTFENNETINSKSVQIDARGLEGYMNQYFYIPVTSATNTTPIEITGQLIHGRTSSVPSGMSIAISDVQGNTAANGTWDITITGPKTFTLNGSVGNGDYVSGGKFISLPQFYTALTTYDNSAYRQKYPEMFNYDFFNLAEPTGNSIKKNIFYQGTAANWKGISPTASPYFPTITDDNYINGDPKFTNAAAGDYSLQSDSPALAMGFVPLPYSKMGRYSKDQLLGPISDKSVKVGNSISIPVTSSYFNDEGVSPSYTTENLPPGAVFNDQTKEITYTPTASDANYVYEVGVQASDVYLDANQVFNLEIQPADVIDPGTNTTDTTGTSGTSGTTGTTGTTGSTTKKIYKKLGTVATKTTNSAGSGTPATDNTVASGGTTTTTGTDSNVTLPTTPAAEGATSKITGNKAFLAIFGFLALLLGGYLTWRFIRLRQSD